LFHPPSLDRGIKPGSSMSGSYPDHSRLEILGVGGGSKVGRLLRRDLTRANHVVQSLQEAVAVLGHGTGEVVVGHEPTSNI
jgi:hypothetical protein